MAYLVGLTGKIGSGKSTVARILELYGIPVYDSDSWAKYFITNDLHIKDTLIKWCGPSIYQGGSYQVDIMREKITSQPELLNQMNALIHPKVMEHFVNWSLSQSSDIVVCESALLLQENLIKFFNKIILVVRDKEENQDAYMQVIQDAQQLVIQDNKNIFILYNNNKDSLVYNIKNLCDELIRNVNK